MFFIIFICVTTLNTSYNKISIFQFNDLLLFITKIHFQKQKMENIISLDTQHKLLQPLYDNYEYIMSSVRKNITTWQYTGQLQACTCCQVESAVTPWASRCIVSRCQVRGQKSWCPRHNFFFFFFFTIVFIIVNNINEEIIKALLKIFYFIKTNNSSIVLCSSL